MVYQAARAVKIPIIGMGGIANAEDAIEFLLAGASAVAVGAMNFVNPYTTVEVAGRDRAYMKRYGIGDVAELIARWNREEKGTPQHNACCTPAPRWIRK